MSKRIHREVSRRVIYTNRNATRYAKVESLNTAYKNPRPVIVNHGWPDSQWSYQMLPQLVVGRINTLLSSGRTLYIPFTGSNFGNDTSTYPVTDGMGQIAFDDVIDAAELDGFDVTTLDFFSTSMGGCAGLNWAWRNPTRVSSMVLFAPLTDMMATYDTALAASLGVSAAMLGAFGVASRSALDTACEDYDPIRNETLLEPLGPRIRVILLTGDEVIPYAGANAFYEGIGADVITSPGSHFYESTQTNYDEFELAYWFDWHNQYT